MVPSPALPCCRRRRLIFFRTVAVCLGSLAGLALLEVALRWFPPVQLRIQGGRIALPLNQRTVIRNTTISKVDSEIVQTRNSLGFRGDDPPGDIAKRLSIVAVGGSTTECYYLSDDQTWPEQLRRRLDDDFRDVWLNNAGLDGHSTYGHLRLFDQFLATLHPKCLVFLIGANDVGLERSLEVDDRLQRHYDARSLVAKAYFQVVEHSAAAALFDNVRRTMQARSAGLVHQDVHHGQLQWDEAAAVDVPPDAVERILQQHRDRYLPEFRARVTLLVEKCREKRILPVLVTQPALFGAAIDSETGVDLGRVKLGNFNGDVQWQVLDLYNSATRQVARELEIPSIDLARQLPKDSRLYYDYYHFTNAGAAEVARIVEQELCPILTARFPEYVRSESALTP